MSDYREDPAFKADISRFIRDRLSEAEGFYENIDASLEAFKKEAPSDMHTIIPFLEWIKVQLLNGKVSP